MNGPIRADGAAQGDPMNESVTAHRPHDAIAAAICARYLQTTMDLALTVGPDEAQSSVLDRLASRSFSQAPVVEDGQILGCVFRDDLEARPKGSVAAVMLPLRPETRVTADALISELLGWLESRRFLFVLDGNKISGFVTIADLNKQPARTYFYLLIAELEMNLAALLRAQPDGPDEIAALLPEARRADVRDRYEHQVRHDVEADLIGAFMFTDVVKAAGRHEALRGHLGVQSSTQWQRQSVARSHSATS